MPHVRTTTLLTTVGLAVGLALTVSGCTGGDGDAVTPTPSTSTTARATGTPTPAGSATPGPTPGAGASSTTTTPATAAGKVPATCDDVVTPGAFDFTDVMPLNDPAVVGGMEIPRTALTPAGRSDGQRLYCVWRDPRADVSNLTVLVEDVVPARATEALRGLSGFDCSTVDDGFRCQQVRQNQQYPVIDGDTYFTRGGIGIHIHQSNVPTDGLLDDVVGNVFR